MKLKIYADTSVFSGCFDKEFCESSIQLIDEFKNGDKIITISDLTVKEIENAPDNVKAIFFSIPSTFVEYVTLDEESKYLAKKYIAEQAISGKYLVDAQHIALSTVNRVDVLVSWNFRLL
ncbi:MAG: type II toxin-antitoxin system VapC family toxin [Candidatus Kuenenia sp.]|nr:type II toxin-antitoxin system VapC family toxin [Candidatus Kuenenia hertensis]